MPIIYRTTPYDSNYLTYLNKLGEENWIFSGQLGDKLVFRKEEKKPVKSRALTTESNKGIAYLKMQRTRIDSGEEIHYPDFVNNRSEWVRFVSFWTQKNTEDGKLHCEKQKTFDAQARWRVWITGKEESKSKTSIG